VFNREDNITVISQCGRVDPTVCFDDIALSPHNMVALDVRNNLVEIHLVSAGRGQRDGPDATSPEFMIDACALLGSKGRVTNGEENAGSLLD
jgi:hypothetical protein